MPFNRKHLWHRQAGPTTDLLAAGTAVAAKQVPLYEHIVVVALENSDYAQVIGNATDAPYINNTLLPLGSVLSSFFALAHPSLPNYLALLSGSAQGVATDFNIGPPDNHALINAPNLLVDRIEAAGKRWKCYAEAMPSDWYTRVSRTMGDTGGANFAGDQNYAEHHNPAVYFQDINSSNANTELANVVPFTQLATDYAGVGESALPDFAFVIPEMDHDMHDAVDGLTNRIKSADNWLSSWIPALLASDSFVHQNSLLVLWWDEDASDAQAQDQKVPLILIGSNVQAGYTSTESHTGGHYDLLRTLELGLGNLATLTANDAAATAILDPFAAPPTAWRRSIVETVTTAADAVGRQVAYQRAPSEAVTAAADTVARQVTYVRGISETVTTASDSVARQATYQRAPSETVTSAADAVARQVGYRRTASETVVAATDAVTRQAAYVRAPAETVTTTSDTPTRLAAYHRAPSETVTTATDSVVGIKNGGGSTNYPRSVSETVSTVTDGVARLVGYGRSSSESVTSTSDAVARVTGCQRGPSESAPTASDSVSRRAAFARLIAETIPLADVSVSRVIPSRLQLKIDSVLRPTSVDTLAPAAGVSTGVQGQ